MENGFFKYTSDGKLNPDYDQDKWDWLLKKSRIWWHHTVFIFQLNIIENMLKKDLNLIQDTMKKSIKECEKSMNQKMEEFSTNLMKNLKKQMNSEIAELKKEQLTLERQIKVLNEILRQKEKRVQRYKRLAA